MNEPHPNLNDVWTYRLGEVEGVVKRHQQQLERHQHAIDQLPSEYVPRAEHEAQKDRGLQYPVIVLSAVTVLVQLGTLLVVLAHQ